LIQSIHMDGASPAKRDRLSLVLGGAALGFTLSKVVQLPTQQFGLQVLGSPLGVNLSTSWLMTLFVVGLVVAGVQSLLDVHPLATGRIKMVVHWILPAITALMAGALLAQIQQLLVWVPVMVSAVILLGLVTVNEYRSVDPAAAGRASSQILVAAFAYSLALAFLTVLYGARLRTLVAAPVAFVVSGLLAARLLWATVRRPQKILSYAAVIGLVIAQSGWALGYWSLPPLSGGTILLLLFYVLTGLAQSAWQPIPGRRALVEYSLTTLLAAIVVLILGPH
jgi:hypothetical protein